jgi:DNA polymerase III subunit delta
MQLSSAQLPAHLNKGLAPLYLLHGAEPLLVIEAGDAIRKAAKAAGYTERTLLQLEARSDWGQLAEAAGTMSLFGDLRILDIRLPTGKPGKQGADALQKLAANLPEDTVTVVTLPQLEREQFKTAWFNALLAAAVVVEGRAVPLEQLPAWLKQRAAPQGLNLSNEAAQFIAQKTEGNLLAAMQELLKLALLCPQGQVSLADAQDAVLDVSRFNIQQLSQALLTGDSVRALKVLDGLEAEDEALPLILWQAADALRTAARGGTRATLSHIQLVGLGEQLALLDRQFKGVASGNPWASLRQCAGLLAARR